MNQGKGGHDFQATEKGKRAKIKVKAKTPTKEKIFSNWALIFTIDNCHLGQALEDMHPILADLSNAYQILILITGSHVPLDNRHLGRTQVGDNSHF